MNLVAIPALTDNYIWMLHNDREALVVDPGETAPVARALDAQGLTLAGILVTHHHADHVGVVDASREQLPDPVDRRERGDIARPCVPLADGVSCSGDTRAYRGHEYALANLRFASGAKVENDDLSAYTAWCEAQPAKDLPALPSSIGRERALNPFLRYPEPGVVQSELQHGAASSGGVEVFAAPRRWKNQF
jgi:hydroxyacylglutathione hydrolase